MDHTARAAALVPRAFHNLLPFSASEKRVSLTTAIFGHVELPSSFSVDPGRRIGFKVLLEVTAKEARIWSSHSIISSHALLSASP